MKSATASISEVMTAARIESLGGARVSSTLYLRRRPEYFYTTSWSSSRTLSAMSEHQFNKGSEPTSFGVFDPTGYVVLAFGTAADLNRTRESLLAGGYDAGDLVAYTADEVVENTTQNFPHRSLLSYLGAERGAAEKHQELARSGNPFLLVRAATDAEAARVIAVARRGDVRLAQKYDKSTVRDLL